MRGNSVRNGQDRWPGACKICLPEGALFENSYEQCGIDQLHFHVNNNQYAHTRSAQTHL